MKRRYLGVDPVQLQFEIIAELFRRPTRIGDKFEDNGEEMIDK